MKAFDLRRAVLLRAGRVFSAFSLDGFDFQPVVDASAQPAIAIDCGEACEPCVMEMVDGSWKIIYKACDVEGRVCIASASISR
jgi:hypothetical protein